MYAPNVGRPVILDNRGSGSVSVQEKVIATSNPFVSSTLDSLDDFRVDRAGPQARSIVDVGFALEGRTVDLLRSPAPAGPGWDIGASEQ